MFVATKVLSRQNWNLWQLPPMIAPEVTLTDSVKYISIYSLVYSDSLYNVLSILMVVCIMYFPPPPPPPTPYSCVQLHLRL